MTLTGKGRGFASLSKEKRRELASLGGVAAHKKGTAHRWNAAEAQQAGRIGGRAKSTRQRKKMGIK
jgi:general stress protein YciG